MKRYVYCMERLQNGSFVKLDNERCTARKLITEKPCNKHPCPSWHAGQWSPVSMSSFGVYHKMPVKDGDVSGLNFQSRIIMANHTPQCLQI